MAGQRRRTTSADLDALHRALENNSDPVVVGEALGMKKRTIGKAVRRMKTFGPYHPSPRGGARWTTWTEPLRTDLVRLVEEHPQYTLDQFRAELLRTHPGERIPSRSSAAKRLEFDLFSLKKAHFIAQERNIPEVKAERAQCVDQMGHLPPNVVPVFVDETGYSLGMRRTLARSRVGHVAAVVGPANTGHNMTVIAAMSPAHGLIYRELHFVAVNAAIFLEFLQHLRAHLDASFPQENMILVLDNCRVHRPEDVAATFNTPATTFATWWLGRRY